jgi:hypothetical protein
MFLAVFTVNASAASRYIRAGATGAADGTSWADAWTTFGAVTWTGSDVYYLAGGTYTENLNLSAANGSNLITIKKANAADNSGDAGWNSSYATTVAEIFGAITFGSDYWFIDGVTRTGFTNGHGIRIERTATTSGAVVESSNFGFIHLKNLEIEGVFSTETAIIDGWRFNAVPTDKKGMLGQGLWIHNVSRNGITTGGVEGTSFSDYGFLFEDTAITEIGGVQDETQHGQGAQLGFASETGFFTFNRCLFRNIIGSAFIAMLGGASDHHDGRIWNCIFYITDLETYPVISPGAIWSHSTPLVENIDMANCTFWGIGSATVTGARARVVLENATGCTLRNCLFESNYFPADHDGVTESNNGYYNNTGAGVPSGTPDQVNGGASTLSNPAAGVFTLIEGGYAIGGAANLTSDFITDFAGVTRPAVGDWDIGAYAFVEEGEGEPANTTGRIMPLIFGP